MLHEESWGQRPDGFMIGLGLEVMEANIKERRTGSREYFWRYDTPREVYCEMKTFKKIVEKMKEGIAHYNNNDKLDLFDKI